ncbi:uncharacterized protein LOC132796515 isoform X1 [Drosophila nasuta]|uniref:uncharacterized protein LOC132796515 isoform X1 n=1 Tax=Drosophila nasuta TaxID=42062 RepID=UPI00295F0D98|nr:uncharacterized protein LOC132796515 isoform X1 [Drosophila nasuta]
MCLFFLRKIMEHSADVVAKREIPRIFLDSAVDIEDVSQEDSDSVTPSNLTLRPQKSRMHLGIDTYQHIAQLCNMLDSQSCVCDAKLLIFAAAANSEGYRSTLVPIPPLFMGESFYDIERLRRIVAMWPTCRQMLKDLQRSTSRSTHISAGHIHLLHWVLIAQSNPILRRYKVRRFAGLCRDLRLQHSPSIRPREVLSVTYKDKQHTVKKASNCRRRYVCFGCPLQLLYRLLIMGRMDNNWAGPLRLYDRVDAALAQCTVTSLPLPENCWSCSCFGRAPRCVLICELLLDRLSSRQQLLNHHNELIIEDTSCLLVQYLLIFTEHNEPLLDLQATSSRQLNPPTGQPPLGASFKRQFKPHCSAQRYRGGLRQPLDISSFLLGSWRAWDIC